MMWKFLWCFIVGHKQLRPRAMALISVTYDDGTPFREIHICKRCGEVFARCVTEGWVKGQP